MTKTRVLADGTYATETVYTSAAAQARLDQVKAAAKPPLRALILGGDFYTSTVLASTLTKLVLRFGDLAGDSKETHALKAEVGLALNKHVQDSDVPLPQAMLIMVSIIRVGQSKFSAIPIDEDSQERIMNCIETLARMQPSAAAKEVFLHDTKAAYAKMVAIEQVGPILSLPLQQLILFSQRKTAEKREKENKKAVVQADDRDAPV